MHILIMHTQCNNSNNNLIISTFITSSDNFLYTKGKKNITSLKSGIGISITNTKGKFKVLQKHYQLLGKMSVDCVFDAYWKEDVWLK